MLDEMFTGVVPHGTEPRLIGQVTHGHDCTKCSLYLSWADRGQRAELQTLRMEVPYYFRLNSVWRKS